MVKARALDQCEAKLNTGDRCYEFGSECDHINPGNDHSLDNLQWLCSWHHKKKSSAEGNKAKKRITEQHPQERHPGFL